MAMKVRYEQKEYKSILNKYKFIDGWFWCRYGINTYSGCEFACTYCDSRSHIFIPISIRSSMQRRMQPKCWTGE